MPLSSSRLITGHTVPNLNTAEPRAACAGDIGTGHLPPLLLFPLSVLKQKFLLASTYSLRETVLFCEALSPVFQGTLPQMTSTFSLQGTSAEYFGNHSVSESLAMTVSGTPCYLQAETQTVPSLRQELPLAFTAWEFT